MPRNGGGRLISKNDSGHRGWFDDYPKTQPSEDQSLFMIGYYHQRKDLFTSKTQEG